MKIKKHVFGISLALILSLSLTSCGIATVDNKTYTSPKEFKISEDFTIAQSGEYSFDFASDAATVVLKNSKDEKEIDKEVKKKEKTTKKKAE